MLQIAGIILIMIATTLGGMYYANAPIFRIKDLKVIKKALMILHSEISYAYTPLPIAMDNIASRIESPINNIFADCAESLRQKTGQDITDIWADTLEKHTTSTYLTREDMDYLKSFGKTLGYLDKEMQINSIAVTTKYIEDKVEELSLTASKNKRLYQTLGILFGLLLVVALW